MNSATINELKVAYDEPNKKSYKKGKFLGKVSCLYLTVIVCKLKVYTTAPCIV